jgi:hypothetical protein
MSGLRRQAIEDLCTIMKDDVLGPGWPVVVTNPEGEKRRLLGITTDIGEELDPDTGIAVAGRRASVALHIRSLTAAGLDLPVHVADQTKRPWLMTFVNSEGETVDYKVNDSMPDTALGLVVCMLEIYKP